MANKELHSVITIDNEEYSITANKVAQSLIIGEKSYDGSSAVQITSADLGVTDTNQKVKVGSATFGANDEVNFVAGSNVTITGNASDKTITISATGGVSEAELISHGTEDPTASTSSQYYFKY